MREYEHEDRRRYAKFFKAPSITALHHGNPALPKYGFHIGEECVGCGKWIRFVIQEDDITENRFYESGVTGEDQAQIELEAYGKS